jgi:hypothetical protein
MSRHLGTPYLAPAGVAYGCWAARIGAARTWLPAALRADLFSLLNAPHWPSPQLTSVRVRSSSSYEQGSVDT